MFRIEELESQLECTYATKITESTKVRRLTDITALQTMIRDAIAANSLIHQSKEERVQIFETLAGEKIYIQYPGKESLLSGTKKSPYDFRPRIRTADGVLLRDLDFAYMWGLIEELDHQRHQMLKLLACVFFRLGRMTLHELVEKDYPCEVLDKDENVLSTCTRHLKWYEFTMSKDVMESINFNAPLLKIDEHTISLEAFLCFFELLLHNEDSK